MALTRHLQMIGLLLLGLISIPQPAAAADPYTAYLMAHFTGESSTGQQIYLAHSTDGLHWTGLNNGASAVRTTVGTRGVRDPAVVRSPAGDRYWIIATDLCIGCGQDLGHGDQQWQPQPRRLGVRRPGQLVGAMAAQRRVTKHRIYAARTTNFRSITTPQPYIVRPGGQEIIDTQIVELPAGLGPYRYVRSSGDGQITIEGSNAILGPWTPLGNLSGIGLTGSQVEGPMWMKVSTATSGPCTWISIRPGVATCRC